MFGDFIKMFGAQLRLISSWHPKSNGIIEILHRHLKAAIMAHQDKNWLEALPFVLLGIRSCFKTDISTAASELVGIATVRPDVEMFIFNQRRSHRFMHHPRKIFARLQPVPASRHCEPDVFVFKELADCKHVFLHIGPLLRALQPPYARPNEAMQRKNKAINFKM